MKRIAAQRFWAKVNKTPACWMWIGAFDQAGYGRYIVDGHYRRAHRVAYELLVGPIPNGLTLDHLCRNAGCVRPSHLEPVTLSENRRRAWAAWHAKQLGIDLHLPMFDEAVADPYDHDAATTADVYGGPFVHPARP